MLIAFRVVSLVQLANGEHRVYEVAVVKVAQSLLDMPKHLFVREGFHDFVCHIFLVDILGSGCDFLDQGCRDLSLAVCETVLSDFERIECFVCVFEGILDVVEVFLEREVFEADFVFAFSLRSVKI